jgi:hypothetical protein
MTRPNSRGAALVTGASSGIGATYADRLARRGHDLVLVARDAERLEALAKRLRADYGVGVEVLPADLTKAADVAQVEARIGEGAPVELVVNNAGVALFGPFTSNTTEALERLIQLNVTALTRIANAAAKAFVPRGRGTLVNVGSVVALNPAFSSSAYGATKAFVLYLTEALNEEFGAKGVTFQAVLPGATRTEIFERAGGDIASFDANRIMEVGEMVDAALAGLDAGELVTIPSLPDAADWQGFVDARAKLGPNLSHNHAAARFGVRALAEA